MKYFRYIFRSLHRDLEQLLNRKLPWSFRVLYPFHKYFAIARYFLTRKKKIQYLGEEVHYDNWTAPLALQAYPEEIVNRVLSNIDQKVLYVLDIGANIGQFSLTFNHFSKKSEIYCFEPNPEAFDLLERNTKGTNGIKLFNCGIGEKGTLKLHYLPGRSCTGSLIEKNARTTNVKVKGSMESREVKIIDDVAAMVGRKEFTLIKIDVEGYEFEVLKNLKGVQTKYLFAEVSGGREKNFSHSKFYALAKEVFGDFDILYQSTYKKDLDNFEVLLGIKE